MNWGQNKFLIGFAAVMVVGCGTLGVLLSNAARDFSQLTDNYDKEAAELDRLQKLPLYPDASNLKKLEDKKQAAAEAVTALQQQLIPLSFPLEAITPEQFQDKLRAAVSAITEKAETAEIKLPKDFYFGFEEYQSGPPKKEAAPVLDRQLKAIELVFNTLISSGVNSITSISRPPLPEEGEVGRNPSSSKAPAKAASSAKPAAAAAGPLLSKYPFDIQFVADQSHMRRALNDLVKSDKQFFIIQSFSTKTENDKQISKTDPASATSASQPAAPLEGALPQKDQPQPLHYLVGTEKVTVSLRLEMVVFAGASSK